MKARLLWGLFALVCLGQWAVPLGLIAQHERTLKHGTVYRFITAPVDPADPFRGRYVALDFVAAQVPLPADGLPEGARYAPIRVDADGNALLAPPQATPPTEGDYLTVGVRWHNREHAVLHLPFDRYYLDERLAPEAERLYWQRRPAIGDAESDSDPRRPAYVQVRVRKGHAVLEELYIDDLPVRERVLQALDATPPAAADDLH